MSTMPLHRGFTLRDLVDWRVRLQQHATGLVAVVFLTIYARAVCPFINGVAMAEVAGNLLVVFVFQVAVRETLRVRFAVPPAGRSLARHGYLLSMASWIIAGLAALTLHWYRYETFPIASHVKLFMGYCIIGAGLLAQWEYVTLENEARRRSVSYVDAGYHLERISRRVMEGFVLFTLAPSVAMALTMARYRYEGLVDRGMVIEIAFLGGFCVLLALAVSFRFGQSLRADARSIIDGTQRIEKGEKDVVLDSSRLDELGAVATGINRMHRELEAGKETLKTQMMEKDAMSHVALAMSSLMPPDTILDLIVENSKLVTRSEASSLLLLDREGRLHFHVAKGDSAAGLANVVIEPGKGIVGQVAATGKALLIPEAYADPQFDRSYDQKSGFRTRTLLTVPMITKGRITGVIQVVNKIDKPAYDAHDQELLEGFAAQAAVSLENAKLLDETRRMAEDLRVALENERNLSIEKEKMGAYIPKSLIDEITKNREQKLALGGKTVPATMLFSDIKGFTALSERLDPQGVVGFLNVYMTAMTNIIDEEGGIVDKFIGDGIMAVFTPQGSENPAAAAVRSGVRMQQRLAQMRREDPDLRNLQMRVGINTGPVVAGNIGSETRMDYTVIGDNVNVASRIEGVCAPDGVLVSASTWEIVRGEFTGEAREPIQVKNRNEPVQTFQISFAT